jgi:hypothetical protein
MNRSVKKKTQSVLFSMLFSILDDPSIALECFARHAFSTSFLNLMFNKKYTSIVIDSFSTCVSKFDEIPEPIVVFLSLVFASCPSDGDSHFMEMALRLMKGMVHALSHNANLGKSFSAVYENCFEFARKSKSREALESSLTILTFIVQSTALFTMPGQMFNSLLDVCEQLEGDEPSEGYLIAMINLLNGATNLGPGQMFRVQIREAISLFLCSFAHSQRLPFILELFYKLCAFSIYNIAACHEGQLDLLVLKGLGGSFGFKNRMIKFSFDSACREIAFKLISLIVNEVTSVAVDRAFFDLLKLDREISFQALTALHALFQNHKDQSFQIWSPSAIIEFSGISGVDIMEGFSFSFRTKIDLTAMKKSGIRFVFLRLRDKPGRFIEIFYQGSLLIFRYESETFRTSAPIADRLPNNEWTTVTATLRIDPEATVVVFRYAEEVSEDIIFRPVILDEVLEGAIGFTHDGTVECGTFSPVMMGQFALMYSPYSENALQSLHANGFSELHLFKSVPLLWTTCTVNEYAKVHDSSIFGLMPSHVTISDFLPLFDKAEHRDPKFVEIALSAMLECTNFQNCKSGKSFVTMNESEHKPFPAFTNMTGIAESHFWKMGSPTSGFPFSMHLSEISTIISKLLHSNESLIDSTLFPVFLEMADLTNDDELKLELLENVIFNPWIWWTSSQIHCQRIFRQLANFLSLVVWPESNRIFIEFLLQTHLFQNFSEHNFTGFRLLKGRILELLPLNSSDLPVFFQFICSLSDEHQIIEYLKILNGKSVVIPVDNLLALCDLVATCSFELSSEILALVTMATSGRRSIFELCLTRLALKWKDLKLIDLIPTELDVHCIHCLRSYPNEINQGLPPMKNLSSISYFWVIFQAVRCDPSRFESVPISLTQDDVDVLVSQFGIVLNFLVIFRATQVFHHIGDLIEMFLGRILLFILENPQVLSKDKLKSVALRAFVASFFRLQSNSISSRLLKKFASSPFAGSVDFGRRPSDFGEFTVESVQELFGSYLREFEFRVWIRKKGDHSLLLRLLELPEFEGDKLLTGCRLYLQRQLPQKGIKFWPLFQEYIHTLNEDMQRQLTEIQLILNVTPVPRSNQLLVDHYYIERSRLRRLHQCAESEEPPTALLASRFVAFPFAIAERVAWTILKEPDKFVSTQLKFSPKKLSLVYSTPCEMVTISGHVNVSFTIMTGEIRISRTGQKVIVIPFNVIYVLLAVRECHFEVFSSGCQSWLLCFIHGELPRVLEVFKSFGMKVLTDSNSTKSELVQLWANWRISNFDLILALNIITGRSLNDIFSYPAVPIVFGRELLAGVPVEYEKFAASVTRWLLQMQLLCQDKTSPIAYEELIRGCSESGVMIPQIYFSFASFDAGTRSEVYESRKSLERHDEKLRGWVSAQFHVDLPLRVIEQKSNEDVLQCVVSQSQVRIAQFFGFGADNFFILSEHNELEIFSLSTNTIIKLRTFEDPLELSENVFFCALHSIILVVDVTKCLCYRGSDRLQSDRLWQSCLVTHMVPFGKSVVFVIGGNLVAVAGGTEFPHNKRTVASESERITHIQVSVNLSFVAYVTEGGRMQIVSVNDGVVIGRAEFRDEVVEKLLVTEYWGFVICKTKRNVYTYSMDGLLLNKGVFENAVLNWVSYTAEGVDHVILLDAGMALLRFEAFYCNKIKKMSKMKKVILAMKVNRQKDTLLLITADGKAVLFPISAVTK